MQKKIYEQAERVDSLIAGSYSVYAIFVFFSTASCILEDLMEVIRSKMSLNRKYLHLLILEQLQSLNLSLGIGEVYYGLHFLPRCKVSDLPKNLGKNL